MQKTELTINGAKHVVQVDDDTPLLWILRDALGLTGTKFGCGVGVCGETAGGEAGVMAGERGAIVGVEQIR